MQVALQHAAEDGGAGGDALVGVSRAVEGFGLEDFLSDLLGIGDPRRAADHHHVVDRPGLEVRLAEHGPAGVGDLAEQVGTHRLEAFAGQEVLQVPRPRGRVHMDVGQHDLGGRAFGELGLGGGRGLLEPLQRHRVVPQVDRFAPHEIVGHDVDDPLVEVVAPEVGVARRGEYLKRAALDLEDRQIERAAAEVEDHDVAVAPLLDAVGQRRRGGFVDDALHLEPGDLPGVAGGLALGVVEVGGDRDHRLTHRFAQVFFGQTLELTQDRGRDLLGGERFVSDRDLAVVLGLAGDRVGDELFFAADFAAAAADETLDGVDRAFGVEHLLIAGGFADDRLAVVEERDHRGHELLAVGRADDLRTAVTVHRDDGVGGAEIDSDDFGHLRVTLMAAAGWFTGRLR